MGFTRLKWGFEAYSPAKIRDFNMDLSPTVRVYHGTLYIFVTIICTSGDTPLVAVEDNTIDITYSEDISLVAFF